MKTKIKSPDEQTPGFQAARSMVGATLRRMAGKTVKSVGLHEQETVKNCHQSEVLVLDFTDGTSVEILLCSNVVNVADALQHTHGKRILAPQDLHASFGATWSDEG